MKLAQQFRGIYFKNPLLLASGTFGLGLVLQNVINNAGGFITKTITQEKREGNPPPRIWEIEGGIVNSIGLENPGALYFLKNILPKIENLETNIIVSIAGFTVEEFITLVKILDQPRINGFELNLSCPNVKEGGQLFGQNPKLVEKICAEIRKNTKKVIIAKLTANFCDPKETAKAAENGGCDFVSLINTLPALLIDIVAKKPVLGGKSGGLSGPFLKPFSLYCLKKVSEHVKIPIIGCGGIKDYKDVLEYLICGASLVELGTINLINPYALLEILEELRNYCKEKQISDIREVIKSAEVEI